MKKILTLGISFMLFATSTFAAEGEMGSFGGITPGVKLETLTSMAQTSKKSTTSKYTLPYKENIYLTGKAELVEGTVSISPGKGVDKEKAEGTYTERYVMEATNTDGTVKLTRDITFETQYIYEANRKQTTKVTKAKKWKEIITVKGQSYTLDNTKSQYSKSVLEDETPGVLYYRGDVHYEAVYEGVGNPGEEKNIVIAVNAPIYGYEQAFAKTETQKREITIDLASGKGYAVEETPTVTVYRDIQYGANEPTAISMAGNYKEIIRSEGALSYNILQGNIGLYDDELSGMMNIESSPTVEQLSIPTSLNLKGHPAETQIKKMYSMKIFDENPLTFSPNQIVTKKEYIKMLVKALQIPLPEENSKSTRSSSKKQVEPSPFKDISEGDSYYPYAVAAYKAGLIDGGYFNGNTSMTRELMYLLNVKAIGLERLGLGTMDSYTPFVDDGQISSWAKSSIYAASNLGIITPSNGYILPKKLVTKAECATFLDQLINYLRYELQKDYNDKMLIG